MTEGLQVLGVGMHRTGSMSLKVALERLGFGPCYHGMEALRRCRDGRHWMNAYEAAGDFDWPVIFDDYRAAMDWPTIYFWEKLINVYPEAKVVLTVRDPDSWWHSHVSMFEQGGAASQEITNHHAEWVEESGFADMQLALGTIPPAVFDGRLFDREHCQRVFAEHNAAVQGAVPSDRLLVYRVEDGWQPLCDFLGVDAPDEDFPRINVGDSLTTNIRTAWRAAMGQTESVAWR